MSAPHRTEEQLPDWSHIEIAAGNVQQPSAARGMQFFVSVVDSDGGHLGLHFTRDYDDAIRFAEYARAEFALTQPVMDIVAEAAQ